MNQSQLLLGAHSTARRDLQRAMAMACQPTNASTEVVFTIQHGSRAEVVAWSREGVKRKPRAGAP